MHGQQSLPSRRVDTVVMLGCGLQVYEALNALGSVGWRVNNEILEVVEEAWAAGGGVAELPDREALPLIPRPAHRWRLVHEGGQLLCQHAKPTYLEERRWKNEVLSPLPLAWFLLVPPSLQPITSFRCLCQLLPAADTHRRLSSVQNSKIKKTNYERHSLKCDMEYKLAVRSPFPPLPSPPSATVHLRRPVRLAWACCVSLQLTLGLRRLRGRSRMRRSFTSLTMWISGGAPTPCTPT